jgi:late competence protein required for DNA uptake (superfamily II DNA/RNA helicase)
MIENMETLPEVITQELRDAIQKALKEMSASMVRVAAEKELQKDIAEDIKEKYDIPKREFNKLAKIAYAANLAEEAAKNESFMIFAEAILSDDGSTTLEHK